MIIDGKKIASAINEATKKKVEELKLNGKDIFLAVIIVGDDPASVKFVNRKKEKAKELGIGFKLYSFNENISQEELLSNIKEIQAGESTALIVQLPLSKHLKTQIILDAIDPKKDADCLTSTNLGALVTLTQKIYPPTPSAIMHILKELEVDLEGKEIVVVGKGRLVGMPLSIMLFKEKSTLVFCDKHTQDLKKYTKKADVLITATGVSRLIDERMIKKGAIVIDAGTKVSGGNIFGDVDYLMALEKAKSITPVPGGVGPVTVAKLFENCVKLVVDK